ncbi:MAG: ribosome biogenesis factor YjgA [Gemmatimonadota bacterium]
MKRPLTEREADEHARDPTGPAAGERPSKSQRKREMSALQDLGESLVRLGADQLARIDLPDGLREAIVEARGISAHEGRRRQLQYVGRLMRGIDPDPIRRALAAISGNSREAIELMHRCERWRDRLIDDDAALTDLLQTHPGIDTQPLRATIRAARRERAAGAAPRHARELYRWLHQTLSTDNP